MNLNINEIRAWLGRASEIAGGEKLPYSKAHEEISEIEEALEKLNGNIPDLEYQETKDAIERLKSRVSWTSSHRQFTTAYNALDYVGRLFQKLFRG